MLPGLAALLGAAVSRHQAGDLKAAAAQYGVVLAQSPDHPEALYLSGALDHQTGAVDEALRKLEHSLAVRPGYLPAVEMLGAVALKAGKFDLAARCFETAAGQKATDLEAHTRHGHALFLAGQHDEAATALRRALALNPQYGDAAYLLATTLRTQGALPEAAAAYVQSIAIQPDNARALDEYAGVLFDLGQIAEAEIMSRRAIAAAPDLANPYTNLGRIYQTDLARAEEALALHDQAIARRANYADAHNNRGVALFTLSRFEDAIASFRHALALKPTLAEAHNNLGNVLMKVGDTLNAAAHYTQATILKPDYAEAHFNNALPLLTNGDLAEGWKEFEWRWQCRDFKYPRTTFPHPQWQGEALGEGKLLLWGEQGLGDEVLYSSMVGDLLDRGITVIWECATRLMPLVQRAFPGVQAVPRGAPTHPATLDPAIRAQISIASLGQYLRRDFASFPASRCSYFRADDARAQDYRQRLLGENKTRLIGVSWFSKNPEFGMHKTSRLEDWTPIWKAAGENTQFVDLQYGNTTAERAAAAAAGLNLAHLPDLDLFSDIDGLASLLAACDMVITVSNTTAHLAGALGIPTWVMIPAGHGQMWYWGAGQMGSMWYPSATVFKQQRLDDWDEVIGRIARQLADSP